MCYSVFSTVYSLMNICVCACFFPCCCPYLYVFLSVWLCMCLFVGLGVCWFVVVNVSIYACEPDHHVCIWVCVWWSAYLLMSVYMLFVCLPAHVYFLCICVPPHVSLFLCVVACACPSVVAYVCVCLSLYMSVYVSACIYVCPLCVHLYVLVYTYCLCVCVWICAFLCMSESRHAVLYSDIRKWSFITFTQTGWPPIGKVVRMLSEWQ